MRGMAETGTFRGEQPGSTNKSRATGSWVGTQPHRALGALGLLASLLAFQSLALGQTQVAPKATARDHKQTTAPAPVAEPRALNPSGAPTTSANATSVGATPGATSASANSVNATPNVATPVNATSVGANQPTTSTQAATGKVVPASGASAPALSNGSSLSTATHSNALTRRAVVERALAAGPSLRSRDAERAAAEARVDQAIAAFLPRIKLSATYRRVSPTEVTLGDAAIVGARNGGALFVGPSPAAGIPNLIVDSQGQPIGAQKFTIKSIENQYELKAELGIPLSDLLLRMRRTVGAAKSATEASRLMVDAERQKIALDASLAYFNFLRADESVRVSQQSLERSRALLEDAKATTRAGLTTSLDVSRVDALVASTEVTVAEAERMRALTRRQLQILLDDDHLDPQAGEIVASNAPVGPVLSLDEATRRAVSNRAELRAMREAVAAVDQRRASYQVARYPRLDGFGQALSGQPNSAIFPPQHQWRTTWAVGVTLSYSPNETVSNGAIVAESEADYERLSADLETADRNIRLQTAAAVLDITKAQTQIDAATRAKRAATEAYDAAQRLYRAGEATTTDVLDAETRLLGAALQLTNAQIDLASAQVRLEHATGKSLTP